MTRRNSNNLLQLLLALVVACIIQRSDATKHAFRAHHDHRTFIGPLGSPFGFLQNGEYQVIVTDFQLKIKDHGHSKKNIDENDVVDHKETNLLLNQLHPGFLLKRFNTENEFAYFQEAIYENVTKCGFEDFIHGGEFAEDDDNFIGLDVKAQEYDDQVASGPGIIDGGGDAGVFLSMKNQEHMWSPNRPRLMHKFTVDEAGFYFLFYQMCLPQQGISGVDGKSSSSSSSPADISKFIFKEVTSDFRIEFHYKNYDSLGKASYLTAGDMPLPHMYLYFTVSYIIVLIIWLQSMKKDTDSSGSERSPTIYAIHHLMSSVVFLKILTMFFEALRYHYIRVKGHAEVWSFFYYFINFFRGTFLFVVILLIGSGWSFFKPYLSTKEHRIILFVIVLQIVDNIAIAFLTNEAQNERLYNDWSAVLHLVDIISCCALFIPIVWQVNSLEESVDASSGGNSNENKEEEEGSNDTEDPSAPASASEPASESESPVTSPATSRLESKLQLFRSFYLIVVGYVYFTRIIVFLFASSLKYNQTWIRYFVYELGTLTFYFMVGMKFKPVVEDHSYAQVNTTLPGIDMDDGDTHIELSGAMGGKVAKD
jgi:hypothetical protein